MTWNYRVLKRKHDLTKEWWYGIYEVYYKNDRPYLCTKEPIETVGMTLKELEEIYKQMKEAFKQPVLDYKDF